MTIREYYQHVVKMLRNAGNDSAEFEVKELFLHSLQTSKEQWPIVQNDQLAEGKKEEIVKQAESRLKGIPLQYLLGEWDFYGRKFSVGEGVLIPRADTEILIDQIKEDYPKNAPLKIIDLCSGSGAIGLTLALEFPKSEVWLLEKSPEAFFYLKNNFSRFPEIVNRTHPMQQDVLSIEKGGVRQVFSEYDLIVSNPPYLTATELESLQKEVKFEPLMALDGGVDGLLFYREITKIWKEYLVNEGRLYYEIGATQGRDVEKILKQENFTEICTKKDYNQMDRIVFGKRVASSG